MKTLLFSFTILIYNINSFAQIDTFHYSTNNQAIHAIWGGLDKNKIETGYLIDIVPTIGNPIFFQDRSLNDSTINFSEWISFYHSLYWAETDTNRSLLDLMKLIELSDSLTNATNSLQLGMINFQVNKIKSNAFDDNLIYLEDNHKLKETNGTNPYELKNVFSICPIYFTCKSREVIFQLNENFIISNKEEDFIKYEYLFEEDTLYTEFYLNTPFSHTFKHSGNAKLKFRLINSSSDTIYCKSNFFIDYVSNRTNNENCSNLIEPDIGPNYISYIPNTPGSYFYHLTEPTQMITGRYAVWHGCNLQGGQAYTSEKRKPILFVTGFNPKNSKTILCWDSDEAFQMHTPQNVIDMVAKKLWRGAYYETFNGATWPDFRGVLSQTNYWDMIAGNNQQYIDLKMQFNGTRYLQKLREKGFDIWIMAVDNGEDKAQHNALVVAQMIKFINNYYLNFGQTEELIVTGYSAGAWSSRFALTMMEKYHKMFLNTAYSSLYPHHRTKLWVSYEGEFYGANTPIGFQEFVNFMANTMNPDFTYVSPTWLFPFTPLTSANIIPLLDNIILSQTNKILNNPASKQLSRYVQGFGTNRSTEAQTLINNIEALNSESRGYPTWCRNISLAQGSGVGIETQNGGNYAQRFAPGGTMFNVEQKPFISAPLVVLPYRRIRTSWNKDGATEIINADVGFKTYLFGNTISYITTNSRFFAGDFKGWDYCPGSTQATANILYSNIGFMKDPINIFNTFNYNQTLHSFAPTAGMFDIRTPESNYTAEENVFVDLNNKYQFFSIKSNPDGSILNERYRRFGYPHLAHPTDHKRITPFDAVAVVGDPNIDGYNTILPNHFHVDDFQPDFLDFLLEEIAPDTVFIQNRDIGNNTPNYVAGFHSAYNVYAGQNVYQKYNPRYWKEPVGEVIINQNTMVDVRGKEIIFTTGFNVTEGGKLHAYLGSTGTCNDDMSQRIGNEVNHNNFNSSELNTKLINERQIQLTKNDFSVNVYPNPISKNETFTIELLNESNAAIEIYDLMGKQIYKEHINMGLSNIVINNTSSSVLIIKIKNQNEKIVYKKLALY